MKLRLPFGWTLRREERTEAKDLGFPMPEHMRDMPEVHAAKEATPAPDQAETKAAKPSTSQQGWAVGTTLFQLGDFPRYNPDDLMIKKGKDIYKRMMMDDQVKAVAEFKRDAVTSRKWFFDKKTAESGKGFDPEHEKMEKFFKYAIDEMEMPFKDGLDAILTGMRHGFSITEKVYKSITWEDKTYWGIKKLVLLPFHTFDGGIVAKQGTSDVDEFRQIVGGRPITRIPRDKVIYFVHRPDEEPLYGQSDFRAAYRAWWSKDIAIKFQNVHLERHAGGFVTANVKDAAVLTDPMLKADLKKTLQNISALTAVLAPAGVEIKLQAPANTEAYDKAIQGYDKAIAKSMLVPNLLGLSEQGGVGSYSQSITQLEIFFWVLDKIVERLEDALNRQLFGEMAMHNFGTTDYPKFKFEPMTESQKMELARTWAELVSKKAVTHSEVDEQHTRKLLGYPELPEEEAAKIGKTQPGQDIDPETGLPMEKQPDPEMDPNTGKPKKKPGEPGYEDPAREVHSNTHKHDHSVDMSKSWMKRLDYKAIKASLDNGDQRFASQLADVMARAKKYIIDQIIAVAGDKSFGKVDPAAIMDVGRMPRPIVSEIRTVIRQNLQRVLEENYELAKKELPRKARMAKEIRPGMDKLQAERFLSSKAMKIAWVLDTDVLNAVQVVLENGIRYDKNLADTIEALESSTELLSVLPRYDAGGRAVNIPARLENIVRTNDSDALNTARMALFGEPEFRGFIQAFEYSSILDDRTTEECEALNGDVRREWGSYTPPNHYQCRSILVPITDEDQWDGRQDKIPGWVKPQKGFS